MKNLKIKFLILIYHILSKLLVIVDKKFSRYFISSYEIFKNF